MANCPRCGAVNRPGKVACWKCLAPIPPPPPAQPTPHTPPSEPKLAVPFRRMLNIPDLTVAFPKRRAHAEQPDPAAVMEPEPPVPEPEVVEEAAALIEAPAESEVVISEETAPEPEVFEETVPEPEVVPEEAALLPEVTTEEELPAVEEMPAEPPVDAPPAVPVEEPAIPELAAFPVEPVEEEHTIAPAEEDAVTEPAPLAAAEYDRPFELADEEDAPEPEDDPAKPARSFIYIAGAAFPHRDRTWISVMVVLVLLIAGIFTLYHHDFRDKPRPTTPQQAAQEYLFYLRDNVRFNLQQLATPDSKRLELPTWFTITDVQLISVSETGGSAHAVARLELAPTNSFDISKALAGLASRSYGVEFTLERGENSWLVDQRTLFRDLRWKMKQADPKVSLPPWDGVSQ